MSTRQKYRIKIRLTYDRNIMAVCLGLLGVAIITGAVGVLLNPALVTALPAPVTSAATLPSLGRLQFYLTPGSYDGGEVLTACAPGYHTASFWEILDPSELQYNTQLGYTTADSGSGPPTWAASAWVRTGYGSTATAEGAGEANCSAWTSGSSSDWGTYIYLRDTWTGSAADSVWFATQGLCSNQIHVWCVADRPGFSTFLPMAIKQ